MIGRPIAAPLPPRLRRRATLPRAGLGLVLAIAPAVAGRPTAAAAPSAQIAATLSPGGAFVENDGASLYANICQGCHMRDGRGATGAAAYPSLAATADLQSASFTVEVVLKGLRGMPAIGRSMTDDQVAAVVNYVRGRFGGAPGRDVTAADVKALRVP